MTNSGGRMTISGGRMTNSGRNIDYFWWTKGFNAINTVY